MPGLSPLGQDGPVQDRMASSTIISLRPHTDLQTKNAYRLWLPNNVYAFLLWGADCCISFLEWALGDLINPRPGGGLSAIIPEPIVGGKPRKNTRQLFYSSFATMLSEFS